MAPWKGNWVRRESPYEKTSPVPIGGSIDGDTIPIGQRLFGYYKPPEKHQQPMVWCIVIRMHATILASGARKAVLLLSSAAYG